MSDARDTRGRDVPGTTYDDRRPGPHGTEDDGGYDGSYDGAAAYDPADDVRAPGWADAAAAAVVQVPNDGPLAPDAVEGNLRRYARWQWRDFWQRRGFWLAGAALFCVWALVHWVLADRLQWGPGGFRKVPTPPEAVLAISHAAFAVGGVLAGLLGVGGIVSRERERGLQRFLFAKPVNVLRYYLQGFAINGVGSMLVLAGAVLLAAVTAPYALSVVTLLLVAAAGYVLGGGATFLVSTLWRFDAPLAGAWLLAGFPMVALAENGYRWAKVLVWLFPHGSALAVIKAVMPRTPMGPSEVETLFLVAALLAAIWGAACTVAGAVVLRRRSISA